MSALSLIDTGALRPDDVLPDVETCPRGGPFPWDYRMRVRVWHLINDDVLPIGARLSDVAKLSAADLLAAEGFGEESLRLMREALARAGLALAGETPVRRGSLTRCTEGDCIAPATASGPEGEPLCARRAADCDPACADPREPRLNEGDIE